MQENSEEPILVHTVSFQQSGKRLDIVAKQAFESYSRAHLQKWIVEGHLSVDGKIKKAKTTVWVGQLLRLVCRKQIQTALKPQAIDLDIIYEDSEIFIINKPVGLVVHPGAGNLEGTMQNALLHYDSELEQVPRCGIVHRLDKDTSGLLIVARNLRSHCQLVAQMQRREIERYYIALGYGNISRSVGSINSPIGRHPVQRIKMAITANGKPAVTHFQLLTSCEPYKLLLLKLDTGRTHQIRVHLQSIKLPVVGDQTYASKSVATLHTRQLLHAWCLQLKHPISEQQMFFEAPLPSDFDNFLHSIECDFSTIGLLERYQKSFER